MTASQQVMPERPRFRRVVAGAAALVSIAAGSLAASVSTEASVGTGASRAPAVACDAAALSARLPVPGVTVSRARLVTSGTYTPPVGPAITGLPPFCAVGVADLDDAGNVMNEEFWLPTAWNGRFQGVGGGGFSCGITYPALGGAARAGYATGSTDCGHTGSDGSFALTREGTLNTALIRDFASTGIHDMTVAGKAVTSAYYASAPAYSYFNGCSTGGRQGLMEAQRFPADYDGIMSGAPAINWTRFIPAEIWPQLVMKESGNFLPTCKQRAFTQAAIRACDALDGVTDRVIDDPARCRWNPAELVGFRTPCGVITSTDARVVAKIWEGPVTRRGQHLWFGLTPGTDLGGLAGTTTVDGDVTPRPFPIAVAWLGAWLQRNPAWDWQTLTYAEIERLFRQSVREFSRVIATDDADLSAFRRQGGKLVIWHGLADPLIFPQGTERYYRQVQHAMGGATRTADFARLFLAPGAGHCNSSAGPAPNDPFQAMVDWVERGRAPSVLSADLVDPETGVTTRSRILCAYPAVARYTGHGSTDDARNYTCTRASHRGS